MKNENLLIIESTDCHTPYIKTISELFSQNQKIRTYIFLNKKHDSLLKQDFPDFYNEKKKNFVIDDILNEKNFFYKLVGRIKQLNKIIDTIKTNKIKFIHVNTIQTPKNIFLILYLLFSSKKIILTIHDTKFNNENFFQIIFSYLQKKLIKKSLFIFLLGNYLKETSPIKNKDKIYINYIYDDTQKQIKYSKKTAVIVNNPDPSIGDFDELFCAFSHEPHWDILIPIKVKSPDIKKYIKKYNLEARIKYYEKHVPENEYKIMLKKSHVAIMPELLNKSSGDNIISSGFSYALAHNLPIITHFSYLKNLKKCPRGIYTFKNKKEIINILKNLKIDNSNSPEDITENLPEIYSKINLFLKKN